MRYELKALMRDEAGFVENALVRPPL